MIAKETDDPTLPQEQSQAQLEWDEGKRRSNVAKHGIDFADCAEIFADPSVVLVKSPAVVSEARFLAIGALRGKLATVIFTRRGTKLRLISARAARRNERERYGKQAQTKG